MREFSDFIPILIALGVGAYQLVKFLSKGKGAEKPKPSRPPTDPFGGGKDETWDDLLEALGQKAKPKNSAPLPPPLPPTRIEPVVPKAQIPTPPIPERRIPPVRKVIVPEIPTPFVMAKAPAESYEFYRPTIAEATELKFKTFDSENAHASHAIPGLSTPVLPGFHADRYRSFLSDQQRLREAIVLNEILNKPLALR